jgi:lipopolysaccharide transport system ATP-binding protein
MTDLAIQVDRVSKQYRIGQGSQPRYRTLRDQVANVFTRPFRSLRSVIRKESLADSNFSRRDIEYIWALRDVSFEVQRGEVVGIIGRNGAGKSTLLKILSRITEPTEGSLDLFGRVGSLLEVGTGFHKELTGRENIYLNGAILGMKKQEIDRKFDEIVSFAETGKFIDTPVKFYSSGMGVRLAFAVAAHLEPEILLIDEVLAVGDVTFQKKCLNKMEDVGQEGRTVLFVSHSMSSITRLCPRAILLDEGRIIQDGPSNEVVSAYLSKGLGTSPQREWQRLERAPGNDVVRLCAVRVRSNGKVTDAINIRDEVLIEIEYKVLKSGYILYPHFTLHNEEGAYLFVSIDQDPAWLRKPRQEGHYISIGRIPGNFLAEGTMIVGAAIRTEEPRILHFYEREAVAFQVIDVKDGISARADYPRRLPGVVRPLLEWSTQYHPIDLINSQDTTSVTPEFIPQSDNST